MRIASVLKALAVACILSLPVTLPAMAADAAAPATTAAPAAGAKPAHHHHHHHEMSKGGKDMKKGDCHHKHGKKHCHKGMKHEGMMEEKPVSPHAHDWDSLNK